VAKKDEKSVVQEQPGFVQRTIASVRRYVNETVGELRKVTWPTRREATNLTIIVLIVTVVMGMYLGLLDFVVSRVFALLFA
jgi:preprotein translocase subunit SecE